MQGQADSNANSRGIKNRDHNQEQAQEPRRKKLKLTGDVSMGQLLEGWTHCQFFIQKKLRLCNMERVMGSNYCCNHLPQSEIESVNYGSKRELRTIQKLGIDKLERIPCPLDGSHSIYRHNLEQHLKICNVSHMQKHFEQMPYYRAECNSGLNMSLPSAYTATITAETNDKSNTSASNNDNNSNINSRNNKSLLLDTLDTAVDPEKLARKVNEIYEKYVESQILRLDKNNIHHHGGRVREEVGEGESTGFGVDGEHSLEVLNDANAGLDTMERYLDSSSTSILQHKFSLAPGVEDAIIGTLSKGQSSMQKIRHTIQDIDILKQMLNFGLVQICPDSSNKDEKSSSSSSSGSSSNSSSTSSDLITYVELGAGRGMLGFAVSIACPNNPLLLVERGSVRQKADRHIVSARGGCIRVRMDIRHCYLPGLPWKNSSFIGNSVAASSAIDSVKVAAAVKMDSGKETGDELDTTSTFKSSSNNSYNSIGVQKDPFVVIAKHLCGVATDLAIRALEPYRVVLNSFSNNIDNNNNNYNKNNKNSSSSSNNSRPSSKSSNMSPSARGLAIATCCHHCCNLPDYTGRKWLDEVMCGLSDVEFKTLCTWTGWNSIIASEARRSSSRSDMARSEVGEVGDGEVGDVDVDVDDGEDEGEDHEFPALETGKTDSERYTEESNNDDTMNVNNSNAINENDDSNYGSNIGIRPCNISRQEMQRLGWRVKRILDQGRVEELRLSGMHAHQVQYCDFNHSPECVMILARNASS